MSNLGPRSWGMVPGQAQQAVQLYDRHAALPRVSGSVLPFGRGRSYGDSCLNPGATLLCTRGLDRYIEFDPASGRLRCESGVTLAAILDLCVPHGWFLPVVPGTSQVTLGGAIANDVHGKNHAAAGSFGDHVTCFELLRSDGERLLCSPQATPDRFAATIGGLGLTGLILWAELQLVPLQGSDMESCAWRFDSLDEVIALLELPAIEHPYAVAWLDLVHSRKRGRGLLHRGRHLPTSHRVAARGSDRRLCDVPATPPLRLVRRVGVRVFNSLNHAVGGTAGRARVVPYPAYFFALDRVGHWNRLYGSAGLLQHQSVLPPASAADALRAMLREVERSPALVSLAVLKRFGPRSPRGWMSFPRPGFSLALDLPREPASFELLDRLDAIVDAAHGALYPAKDARMSAASFQRAYPRLSEFTAQVDPAFSSAFWRRMRTTA